MPTVKKASTSSRKRKPASTHTPQPRDQQDLQPDQLPAQNESGPPGRLRKYLPTDDPARDWSLQSSSTVEGRLAGQNEADWHVPVGDETHLWTDDGRLRLGDGGGTGGEAERENGFDPYEERSRGRNRGDKYKTDNFYVKPTNSHDHSVPWKTSITADLAQAIDAILRSEKLPFRKSREQFTAVALYELVQVCLRLEPIPDSDVAILESMNQLNRTYQVVVGYDSMIRRKCSTMHDLVERGLKNTARVMLHETLRIIGRMKNRELREKHYKRVRAEFGGLIRESKPISGRAVRTSRHRR